LCLVIVEIWVDNITSSSIANKSITFPVLDSETLLYRLLVHKITWLNSKTWLKLQDKVNVVVLLRRNHLGSKVRPVFVIKGEICEIVHVIIVNPLAVDGEHVDLRLSDVEPSIS
jgi:hypothetical protein